MSIAENIIKLRAKYKLTQQELGKIAGVTDRAVSAWEKGTAEPRMGAVQKMADHFMIPKSAIVDDVVEASVSRARIPVFGEIPAGIPLEMIEDIDDWEEIPERMAISGHTYFGLRVKGNSMYPKYITGDTIIARVQPDCENGQDCVVRVNGDSATLKKVVKSGNALILQPINPEYEPMIFTGDETEPSLEIMGIVVELRRKI